MRSQAVELVARGHEVVVVVGEGDSNGWPLQVTVNPALGYAGSGLSDVAVDVLADWLEELGGWASDVIFHLHNPTLGKNPAMARLAEMLVRRGRAVVAQVHDFAEDGRPLLFANLSRHGAVDHLYPIHPRLLWLTLNPEACAILARAGVPEDGLLALPNPVEPPSWLDPCLPTEASLILYPGRGIERKNLGEFLLWSLAAPNGLRFATTLRPAPSSAESESHQRWEKLTGELGMPVAFGIGENGPIAAPRAVISTSVREGFGLAYAEPWLAGIPAGGRLPPHATALLERAGVVFPAAYRRLLVDRAWLARIGADRNPGDAARDFGGLSTEAQEFSLRALAARPADLDSAMTVESADGRRVPAKEWLHGFLEPCPAEILSENLRIVRGLCDPAALAERLERAYGRILAAPAGSAPSHADPSVVRAAFSPSATCPNPEP